jgi:predicted alpha/beta hydrolase
MADTLDFAPKKLQIPALDGLVLGGRVYEPEGARCTILVLGGIGVPQRAFRHFGAWCAPRGVRVVTVDYRGIGESPRDAAALDTATLSNWARLDAVGALRFVEERWPEQPPVLLGHSFGGQTLGFSDEFRRLAAAVLVASQFGEATHWDGFDRLKVSAYWNLILPSAAAVFTKQVPGWTGIGESIPAGVAREWALWGRSRGWSLAHVPFVAERYAAFDRPLRAYSISDDKIAPPRAVSALLDRFRSTEPERIEVTPPELDLEKLGHLGLFRAGAERIWQQIADFAAGHSASSITRAG